MEKLPSKDIERMMTFINHEAEEKIKEMRIKAIQEYNTEKARIVKEETMKAENSFVQRQKEIERRRIMVENSLMNAYKQKYLKEKVKILDEIYEESLSMCSRKPLNISLVEQCVNNVDGEFVIYCNKKDKKAVQKHYKDVEIRDMIKEGVGGAIVCLVDHNTVVDNSYMTRMKTIKDMFEARISKIIFD